MIRVGLLLAALSWWAAPARADGQYATLHVADLLAMLAKPGAQVSVYDANTESTRAFVGIIPGAHLVDDPGEPLLKQLPRDKARQLVFYCANTYCSVSELAARRALGAGYTHVGVLVDGIYGWRGAGQPVRKIPAAPDALDPQRVRILQRRHAALLVDVREGEERHEIVEGATWMPMSDVENPAKWAAWVKTLPHDKTIVTYCAVGVRARRVAEMLREEGVHAAYFQGPDQWRAAGLPLKPGPAR